MVFRYVRLFFHVQNLYILIFASNCSADTYFDLFLGYDILSHETETDILDGMVSIIIVTLFVSLGVYSQR